MNTNMNTNANVTKSTHNTSSNGTNRQLSHPSTQALTASRTISGVTPSSQQPVLAPGWAPALDATSGRTYYYNASTAQSQWDPPLVDAPQPAAIQPGTLPRAAVGVHPAMTSKNMNININVKLNININTGANVNSNANVNANVNTNANANVSTNINANVPVFQQSTTVVAEPAPAPSPKMELPDSEGVLLLEHVINAVTGKHLPNPLKHLTCDV
jgi:hypothetical protein